MGRSDAELFKDKIEVSLDGRQIFFLFFGGAVIASLVFVLGVMVGKRVEARAHVERSAATSAALDPLAALDQLGTNQENLTFPSALTGAGTAADMPLGAVDAKLTKAVAAEKAATEKAAVEKAAERKAAAEKAAEKAAAEKAAAEKAAAEKAAAEKAAAEKAAAEKAAAEKAAAEKAAAEKAAAEEAAAASEADPDDGSTDGARASKSSSKFTLQLSSFQDRSEAEAFHQRLIRAGYEPYIARAEVPDKGTWYRVRLGGYSSYTAAVAAKKKFEAEQKIIAYVTRVKR